MILISGGKAEISIEVTEEEIVISFNDEHSSKACFPIEVTEEGIVISVNDEQQKEVL